MTGWLPGPAEDVFGAGATAEEAYELLTVDVPAASWPTALDTARSVLGCTFFDWLSAVDEPGTGFRVCAHLAALPAAAGAPVRRLLLRTTVPHEAPVLPTAVHVYAGAAWHERETHEMFGIDFTGHPHLVPLLLPEGFEGHPLRKDFVLAARVAKAWPGAKEPGESEHGGPKRRQMLPPGVPDPNEWGPLKGQLPPAPSRPARPSRGPATDTDRPARRTRTASEGSAAQRGDATAPGAAGRPEGPAAPRRARSVSDGSASQRAEPAAPAGPRRNRSAADGSASQQGGAGAVPRRARSASDGSASQRAEGVEGTEAGDRPAPRRTAPRSPDAPWHHARPAFGEPEAESAPAPEAGPQPEAGPAPAPGAKPAPAPETEPAPAPEAGDAPGTAPRPGGPSAPGEAAGTPDAAAGDGAEPESRADGAHGARGARRAENDNDPAGGDPA
ncbi:NADH-quinone oxidoreductase subunit C [Streptomyces caatingaensis]|uniref:NADH-quinone oxidoreductase subunit C n=1 Tax=Streptomyces caatingaensis TaxID=1678637 RepID=UPI00099BA5FE|nr:NADH-quinone oxidoreductase subunit C [Streptomyces caatingaensis]